MHQFGLVTRYFILPAHSLLAISWLPAEVNANNDLHELDRSSEDNSEPIDTLSSGSESEDSSSVDRLQCFGGDTGTFVSYSISSAVSENEGLSTEALLVSGFSVSAKRSCSLLKRSPLRLTDLDISRKFIKDKS